MNTLLVYVYASLYKDIDDRCNRFVRTYLKYPPEYPHRMCVVVNGSKITDHITNKFNGINCEFVEHDNTGWDIGAYMRVAEDPSFLCDGMFLCGSATHFKRNGWLNRICSVWDKYGPNLYGSHGSYKKRPHIRTATGVLVPPFMLICYPHKPIITTEDRYRFEHGIYSVAWFAGVLKHKALVVSWEGIHEIGEWPNIPNGFNNGDQGNCLCYDRVTDVLDYRKRHNIIIK